MDVSFIIRLIDQVSQPAQKMRDAIGGIGEAAQGMKQGFGQAIREGFSVENIENATKNAEQALQKSRQSLLGAFAMATAIAAPVFSSAGFEEQMRNVGTLVNTTVESIDDMGRQVIAISGRVPVALQDLTGALYDVRSAGISASDAMSVLEGSSRLAVAGLGSSKEAVDLVTSSINAFNLEGAEQERIYDVIFKTVKNGKTTISELSQGFGAVAGTVAQSKIEIDEYLASVAALTTTGIPAAQAHTQIRAAISGLTRDTKETKAVFDSLGADSFKDLVEKSGGMVPAFQRIAKALDGNDAEIIKLLGSVEAYNALIGLTGGQNEAYLATLEDMRNGANAVDEAFRQQSEGFNNQLKMLRNEAMGMVITLGTQLLPIFKQIVMEIKPIVKALGEWMQANPELTATIVKTVAALLAMLVVMRLVAFAIAAIRLPMIGLASTFLKFDEAGKNVSRGWMLMARAGTMLGGAFGIVKGAALAVVTALGAVTAPVWLAVAAIVAAGFAVWKYWDRVSSFVSGFASVFAGLWDGVKSAAAGASDWVIEKIGSMLNLSPDQIAAAKEAFREFFDFSGWIDGAKQLLSDFWGWLGSFFSQEKLSEGEKGEMYAAGQNMGKALIDGIMSFIKVWISPIQALFKFALEIDWPEPPAWLKWLMERGGNLLEKGGELISGGGEKVTAAWDETKDWAVDIGGGGAPPPGVTPERSWSFDGIWSSLTGGADDASAGLAAGGQKGGDALAKGGQDAAQELRSAARDISAAASGLRSAAASARSAGGGGSVAGAISDSRTGALHGGTD